MSNLPSETVAAWKEFLSVGAMISLMCAGAAGLFCLFVWLLTKLGV